MNIVSRTKTAVYVLFHISPWYLLLASGQDFLAVINFIIKKNEYS